MKTARVLALIVILTVLGVRQGWLPDSLGTVPAAPEAPSDELRALVLPVRDALKNEAKGAEISRFYAAFSDVTKRDNGQVIRDTLVFERTHRSALQLYGFSQGPMVGELIDSAIAAHLGIDKNDEGFMPGPVDPVKLSEILSALSWAAS